MRGSGRFPCRDGDADRRRARVLIPFIAGQWSLLAAVRLALAWQVRCFNPLHCGAVVASCLQCPTGILPKRFNPLHCGAVVASVRPPLLIPRPEPAVSIPFIAGQWSLQAEARAVAEEQARFNPLHCGAVVASRCFHHSFHDCLLVSIPFIAGQWSLLAGVAGGRAGAEGVSIPFIAGQWSLRGRRKRLLGGSDVSIPFIAGQWSLRPPKADGGRRGGGFNPLHCGAVVASGGPEHPPWPRRTFQSPSLRGSGRFRAPEEV